MRSRGHIGLVLVTGAALLAGCGSGDSDPATSAASAPTTTMTAAAAASTDKVAIADFAFDPETITVDAGTKVTWANSDDAIHTATADDGSFDTGDLDKGDSKSITLEKPGTYAYFCRFHPFMKATVEVQ
jgi:plastocyanin